MLKIARQLNSPSARSFVHHHTPVFQSEVERVFFFYCFPFHSHVFFEIFEIFQYYIIILRSEFRKLLVVYIQKIIATTYVSNNNAACEMITGTYTY